MNNKSKSTFRAVVLLIALISVTLSISFEFNPDQYNGLGMAILSGMCFIALAISFIGE